MTGCNARWWDGGPVRCVELVPMAGEEVGCRLDDRRSSVLVGSVFQPIQEFGDFRSHGVELHMTKFIIPDRRAAGRVKIQGNARVPTTLYLDRIDFDYRHARSRTPQL